jgi:hypothetical protein
VATPGCVPEFGVSFDTTWRFFGAVLGITSWERPIMFAVVEAG